MTANASMNAPAGFRLVDGAAVEVDPVAAMLNPAVRDGTFRDVYVDPRVTPFTVAVGVFALVLFACLAAVDLTLEAPDDATREALRRRALASAVLTGVLALVVFALAGHAPHVREGLT